MRILAFVDIHGNDSAIRILKDKAREAEILVCAGDISVFEHNLAKTLRKLDSFGKPLLIIHGNHETAEAMDNACIGLKNTTFLHEKAVEHSGICFYGFGGGGFERTSPEIDKFFKKTLEKPPKTNKSVFVFHAPPFNTSLDGIGSSHDGNKTIRDLIYKYRPTLVVCGHFHENACLEDNIGESHIVNPGPFGILFEL